MTSIFFDNSCLGQSTVRQPIVCWLSNDRYRLGLEAAKRTELFGSTAPGAPTHSNKNTEFVVNSQNRQKFNRSMLSEEGQSWRRLVV